MSGWPAFRTPKEEVAPDSFSNAVDEDDSVPSQEAVAPDSFSNAVDEDDSVSSQEEFYEDNWNVFGCLPSSSKSEGWKQSYATYQVQPRSFRSVAAAAAAADAYPGILNIQTLVQRKPSPYPNARVKDAKKTTNLQKSSQAPVTRPEDTETNQLGVIEAPHTQTQKVRPEVMFSVESVAKRKASSRKRIQTSSNKPPPNTRTTTEVTPAVVERPEMMAAKETTAKRKASSCESKRIQSNTIEAPHAPTTFVTPDVITERPQVMTVFESVSKWKASSCKRVSFTGPDDMKTNQAFKPLHKPMNRVDPIVITKRLQAMADGRKQPFVAYKVQPESVQVSQLLY
jgi:hypothetical protein